MGRAPRHRRPSLAPSSFDGDPRRQLRWGPVAVRYKQPSSINGVSAVLVALVAVTAWVVLSAWPVIAVNSGVKNEIDDVLPRIYRANLRPEPGSSEEIESARADLTARLRLIGVADPKLTIEIHHDAKLLSVEVRYHATATLKGTQKSHTFDLRPRVETDATRVEW